MSRSQKTFFIILTLTFGALFGIASPAVLQAIFESAMPDAPRDVGGAVVVAQQTYTMANSPANILASALLGMIVGGVIARVLIKLGEQFDSRWDNWDKADKTNLVVGIFGGLIASTPVAMLLNSLNLGTYRYLAIAGLWLGCMAATVYALRSMGDILPWAKDRGPGRRSGVKILDTNVLIDGRLYDVARTGFMDGPFYVPGFVLEELQYIADSHDALRRQRGRRGLDVLRMLQADYPTEVRVNDKLAPDIGDEVDARLVRLARAMGADIVTNDFNLNRVASLQQVRILNLNDLALAMRPNVLPSESLVLAIVREGNQVGQGVGYLEDGTMVVVENGKAFLGQTVDVTVTQVIQTERGKMIFGEVTEEDDHSQNGGYDGQDVKRKQPRKAY